MQKYNFIVNVYLFDYKTLARASLDANGRSRNQRDLTRMDTDKHGWGQVAGNGEKSSKIFSLFPLVFIPVHQ